MKKIFFLISLIAVLAACTRKDKLPDGVLPREKMEAVLWDLVRAGEFLDGYVLNKDSAVDRNAVVNDWYDHIFNLHKVSRPVFEKSYAYYQDHPALMNDILDSLNQERFTGDTSVSFVDTSASFGDTSAKVNPRSPEEALKLHEAFLKRRLVRPPKDSLKVK